MLTEKDDFSARAFFATSTNRSISNLRSWLKETSMAGSNSSAPMQRFPRKHRDSIGFPLVRPVPATFQTRLYHRCQEENRLTFRANHEKCLCLNLQRSIFSLREQASLKAMVPRLWNLLECVEYFGKCVALVFLRGKCRWIFNICCDFSRVLQTDSSIIWKAEMVIDCSVEWKKKTEKRKQKRY